MRLRDGDGRELAFVRRKGAKNTLLAADGSSPLPDAALANLLGGITEDEFSRRFALDHDELVAGGKSILEGAGELGQLLFQAGGGLKDLLQVQRNLDRELESLFKPSGTRPRINAGLAELKEARALVREGSLPSTEWVEHDAAHRRAAEQLEEVEGRLESARAERRRLERIADALPVLARLRQYQQDREALGPVVLLPDDFTEQRHQAIGQLESARAAESTAARAIAELDAQIDALVVPEDLLAEAEAIERLRDGLPGFRKAQDALPAERGRLRLIEAEVRELLAELRPAGGEGPGTDVSVSTDDAAPADRADWLDAADTFRPTRTRKATISRLAAELARLTAEQEQAGRGSPSWPLGSNPSRPSSIGSNPRATPSRWRSRSSRRGTRATWTPRSRRPAPGSTRPTPRPRGPWPSCRSGPARSTRRRACPRRRPRRLTGSRTSWRRSMPSSTGCGRPARPSGRPSSTRRSGPRRGLPTSPPRSVARSGRRPPSRRPPRRRGTRRCGPRRRRTATRAIRLRARPPRRLAASSRRAGRATRWIAIAR